MTPANEETNLSELDIELTAETDDAVEALEAVTEAADDARVAMWKLNDALAYLETCRDDTAELQE